MPSASYSDLCKTIYKQLLHKLERRDEETLRFAVSGTAAGVLHYDNLVALFSSLAPSPQHSAENEFGISGDEFASRVDERRLHDFLAILIFASCDVDAARKFTAKLVATDDWPRKGRKIGTLPVDLGDCEELFDDVATADQFLKNQAYFCTVILREKEQNVFEKHDGRRFPYLEETALSEGSFGKVYAVKIAKGHFVNSREGMVNDKPRMMARKDYMLRPDFDASDEANVMKIILGSSARGHPNILENIGSLEVGNTYSLFMPLAICDLKEYMMKINPHSPTTSAAKANLIRSAEGLAEGLAYLHNDIRTSDLKHVVCYHMDLKPANILVFRENIDGEDRDIWKLSDFGMSRVKIKHGDRGEEPERMFDRRFIRRKPADVSVSATMNRRGEGTYLAPESTMAKKRMRTESDVWSLGCIVSVVFTYLDAGYKGVEDFSTAREEHPNAKDMDRFFCSSTSFTRTQTNPAVKKWHMKLVRKAYARSTEEGDVFKGVLEYLDKSVLVVDQGERRSASSAKDVASKLKHAFDQFRSFRSSVGDDINDGNIAQPHLPISRSKLNPLTKYFRKPSPHPMQDYYIQQWTIPTTRAFKGCAVSRDGTLVAYYTDTMIALYTSESLSHTGTGDLDPSGAEYVLEDKDCFWQCISLTSRYLIASTTKPNFDTFPRYVRNTYVIHLPKCFIFDLRCGPSVDVSLDHFDRVSLPIPEIQKVAISYNSQWLACIIRHEEGEKEPGFLLYSDISTLVEFTKRRRESASDTASSGADSLNEEPWRSVALGFPAADVTHLSFSYRNEIYVVIQPELTVKIREHKIPVLCFSPEKKTLGTLVIQSQGLDSGTVRLFTTFSPLHTEETCAVITREKHLHIRSVRVDDVSRDVQTMVKGYRFVKVLTSWQDDKIFALGTQSANNKMLLMEFPIPRPEEEVEVATLTPLNGLSYGEEFAAALSSQTEEKYLIVSTLRGTIYKVVLPG
ncbi:Sec34-like family protein [Apiospora arundinis]|uniref:LRR receptor-like serine/threonine-protein kinase n=1 Tax=Apiospora arundinis TaxID=335852 RepID=A0ABR2JA41_9PEZI